VNHPVLACMASQYAGWAVNVPGRLPSYFAMGSGPARALFAGEPLFETLELPRRRAARRARARDRELPTEEVAEWVAGKCGVAPQGLRLLAAPTASLAGSVQIAARIVETGLHKLHEVGFDLGAVRSGFGTCPLAPVAADDMAAIGRTNDGVLYGGRAWYTVATDDAAVESVIERLPSSASRDYGEPFAELFARYEGDFYKIDPLLFSPAEVSITNMTSGRTFRAGQRRARRPRAVPAGVRAAILGQRGGWHTESLLAALRRRGVDAECCAVTQLTARVTGAPKLTASGSRWTVSTSSSCARSRRARSSRSSSGWTRCAASSGGGPV
jgi:methenyltetrahydromethanopterin cyclohydrolase